MTSTATKDAVIKKCNELEDKYKGQPWFKKVAFNSDEGGPHIDLKITSIKEAEAAGFAIPRDIAGLKVCVFIN